LAPGARVSRNTESGSHVASVRGLKTYQLGADLGLLAEHLADSANPASERQLADGLGEDWTEPDIQDALQRLIEVGIATASRPIDQSITQPIATPARAPRLEFRPPLSFQWNLLDPQRVCQALAPLARLLTGRPGLILSILGAGLQAAALASWPSAGLAGASLPQIVAASAIALLGVAVHELAHGVVLAAAGGRPRRLGFMLFYFTPAFFCDVSDSWRLGRRDRVRVALAGVASQCQFGALAALVGLAAGRAVPAITLFLAFNLLSAIVNLFPFIKLDGYLALMAAVDIPNLRASSIKMWRDQLGRLTGTMAPVDLVRGEEPVVQWWRHTFGAVAAATPPTLLALAGVALIQGATPEDGGLAGAFSCGALAAWPLIRLGQALFHTKGMTTARRARPLIAFGIVLIILAEAMAIPAFLSPQ
jgi:putative peptide zinc metalloprotease protein